jgi:hypothetical protein
MRGMGREAKSGSPLRRPWTSPRRQMLTSAVDATRQTGKLQGPAEPDGAASGDAQSYGPS